MEQANYYLHNNVTKRDYMAGLLFTFDEAEQVKSNMTIPEDWVILRHIEEEQA